MCVCVCVIGASFVYQLAVHKNKLCEIYKNVGKPISTWLYSATASLAYTIYFHHICYTIEKGKKGYTNFVQIYVTSTRRRSRPHKVYVVFLLRIKRLWAIGYLTVRSAWL